MSLQQGCWNIDQMLGQRNLSAQELFSYCRCRHDVLFKEFWTCKMEAFDPANSISSLVLYGFPSASSFGDQACFEIANGYQTVLYLWLFVHTSTRFCSGQRFWEFAFSTANLKLFFSQNCLHRSWNFQSGDSFCRWQKESEITVQSQLILTLA